MESRGVSRTNDANYSLIGIGLNPWKTRFLLNYKNLNYKTEWTEYPDLRKKLEGKYVMFKGQVRSWSKV